jgi:predicted acyl esterase
MIEERDLRIRMRDGVRLALDVYRPDGKGPFPVLYAAALHNKDIQGPDMADVLPTRNSAPAVQPGGRREPDYFQERAREVALVGKTAKSRDLREAFVRIVRQ